MDSFFFASLQGFASSITSAHLPSISISQGHDRSRQAYENVFAYIQMNDPRTPRLPAEISNHIVDLVLPRPNLPQATLAHGPPPPHPALTPPRSGISFFMKLPTELRRLIFTHNFPDQGHVFHPWCGATDKKRPDPSRKLDKHAHNVPNLMTLNRTICGELTEVMYQERTFVIHVHEGFKTGGVEILNAGRQPLQYLDNVEDKRFAKFEDGKAFGFSSMKKIIIEIHPTTEDQDRHVALNTHFMILALCRLLERPGTKNERITSIKVRFAARDTPATDRTSRAAIMRHEKPWMDAKGPKQSSIHCISDIELVLRPFAMLTACHNASVELPSFLADDQGLAAFVDSLQTSMRSAAGTLKANELLEHHVENLRPELEEHVLSVLYGKGKSRPMEKLTDKEVGGESISEDDGDGGDRDMAQDEGIAFRSEPSRNSTYGRSLSSATPSPLTKRRKTAGPSQTLRRSSRVKDAKAARKAPISTGGEEEEEADVELQVVMLLSRGELTDDSARAILQDDNGVGNASESRRQTYNPSIAENRPYAGGMSDYASTAETMGYSSAMPTSLRTTTATSEPDVFGMPDSDTNSEGNVLYPAALMTATAASRPDLQSFQPASSFQPTTVAAQSNHNLTTAGYVAFGHHGPMPYQAPPRVAMMTEDSGIGMLRSEDGAEKGVTGGEEMQADEVMN